MSFEMSETSQIINVYNLRIDTKEFIGSGQAYVPAHTGLPANCTTDEPPEIPPGYVAVFDESGEAWTLYEDHRGQTIYDTLTGLALLVSEIGALPANMTTVVPTGDYQKWNGNEWVTDADAEKAAQVAIAESYKSELMSKAANIIDPLQDSVELNMATDEEKEKLTAWKVYRVLLNRIDTSGAPDISWPELPAI